MPNDYYEATPIPRQSSARSALPNAEFAAIQAAFDLLPAPDLIAEGRVGYGVTTGVANAYALATVPAPAFITEGMTITAKIHAANTAASTLNLNATGARQIRDFTGAALVAGVLPLGAIVTLRAVAATWRMDAVITANVPTDGSVTNAKHAPIPANTLKGGTGTSVTDLTAAQARALLDLGAVLSDGTDVTSFDAISASGLYRNSLPSPTGAPLAATIGFSVIHVNQTPTAATQIATMTTDLRIWIRRKTASTWSAWTELFSRATILGTVSQASGVPTGAVIEQGSNANGSYTRWADGTQICWNEISVSTAISTALVGGFRSSTLSWTYPAAFSLEPGVNAIPTDLTAVSCAVNTHNTTVANISWTAVTSQVAATRSAYCIAVGRWF